MNDDQLFAAYVATGNDDYFAELHNRLRGPLLHFIEKRYVAGADAEDPVQEAFIHIQQHPELKQPIRPYLFSVAANLAIQRRAG